MAAVGSSSERAEFLQQLKPACVPLSKLALRPTDTAAEANEILSLVESVDGLWAAQVSKNAQILDGKLADYVFFPVAYLLRNRHLYPVRVLEAIIRLLKTLIQHGWKAKISRQLSQQLLVFLSLTLGGDASQQLAGESQPTRRREMPEETVIEGFRTLAALITAAESSPVASSSSLPPPSAAPSAEQDQTIPALGQNVTVMLDAVTSAATPSIQLEALACVQVAFTAVRDNSVLAQFLPGTVSSLTKLLSPPLQNRTQKRVLVKCLAVLKLVLTNVLGDIKVRGLLRQTVKGAAPEPPQDADVAAKANDTEDVNFRVDLTPAWLKATTAQVKIALSSVLKLRTHEANDVQSALSRLCIGLLDECHSSLVDCQSILVESAMMLDDEESSSSRLETNLRDLAGVYPEIAECIKLALYNWITSLPRSMQSNDERVKQLAIRNILRGTKLAADLQVDSSTLDDTLGDALRDSIAALIRNSKPSKVVDDGDVGGESIISGSSAMIGSRVEQVQAYSPVLFDLESQKTTRGEINALISNVGSSTQQAKLATAMLGYLRDSDGVDQIASYWLAFELLKSTYAHSSELDDLLDFGSLDEVKYQDAAFQELYEFSASVLSSHSESLDDADWRLEAIALEVTAFAASRLEAEFRPELIDVLYPVTTFLGSQVPQLRRHAITTLNILAVSCGYASVSELIVDNADYMVNSVSLRLNTFDISPASTKVLTMMVRLTGPRLIPFMDDVVAAIFAALDNYHGYPVFVESLFSVLSEVVTQGVKSDMLLLEDMAATTVDHRKRKPESAGIPGTLDALEKRAKKIRKRREEDQEDDTGARRSYPKEAWGPDKSKAKSLLDSLEAANNGEEEEGQEQSSSEAEKPKPPNTPTYSLLTRVLSLTQHYLTSPTPTLRKSLLDLVATVSPALAPDENAFLPLVHTVWPVVISRLHDPEPFVAIAACRALAALCSAAGDFLASRFKTEWSDGLYKWFVNTRDQAAKARGGTAGGHTGSKGKAATGPSLPRHLALSSASNGNSNGTSAILIPSRSLTAETGEAMADAQQLMRGSLISVIGSKPTPTPSMSLSLSSSPGAAALGRFAQASQIWDAAVGLLGAIVAHVRLDDDMFDDMLDLVADVVSRPQHAGVREALEAVNADAVWLAMYERGLALWQPAPQPSGGISFAQMAPRA
ncbi:armadillo-type protein [Lasiosphaeria miniovina]|uniref:Armadillo-type protein n=1 Tax=Lasiosphaeria miniovina TaxID=1954250 RepID=A0AA40E539_9PEZI|nr:armadillo-type protein [Lasiosphaeria miniovina]KAK0722808.1 armadillo-type protein [Lasiosphaeria miniovina]